MPRGGDGRQKRRQPQHRGLEGRDGLGDDANALGRDIVLLAFADDLGHFLLHGVHGLQRTFQEARPLHLRAQVLDLGADGGLVGRQLRAERLHLHGDKGSQTPKYRQHQSHGQRHRQKPRQPVPHQPVHQRPQHEADEKGDRQRDQHHLPEVERGDDDGGDHQPGGQAHHVGLL